MEFEKFEKFLKDNDVYKEFYQEFIYSEDGIDLSEETDNNVYVEAHRNAKENLQDIILTEGIKEVLSNGFIFFYEGNNKNTITDVEWKDIFEQYGEEKSTEDIEQYYVIPLDFQLTENAFCHKANIDEIELNQIIIYINQKYIVTSKNQTLEARNTSKTCHKCGVINNELTLKDRIFECKACSYVGDRDHNACINIMSKVESTS